MHFPTLQEDDKSKRCDLVLDCLYSISVVSHDFEDDRATMFSRFQPVSRSTLRADKLRFENQIEMNYPFFGQWGLPFPVLTEKTLPNGLMTPT